MDEVFGRLIGRAERIGIMGGTFDPIHYGHLSTAETVRTEYNPDRIVFIPTGVPPHKRGLNITSCEHRYIMVQLAAASNPYFDVSRIEIDREGFAYTVDTIKEIRGILGSKPEIIFITGADALLEIMTWKSVGEIFSMCQFLSVTRPGYRKEDLYSKIDELKSLYGSSVLTMDVPALDVSSTEIRNRVNKKLSIKYLVPESVENYIIKNGLYARE